jgi:methylenetetrahydrofolate reductase (NADPH)
MLSEAGIDGYCSTQMCFNPTTIAKWMRTERERGMTLPIHLGVSGVVDKSRLLTMGARLGVGQSLSYLRKNRAAVTRMLTSAAFEPADLLMPLSEDMVDFAVEGLHVFTFNQVAATNAWRLSTLNRSRR